MIDIKLQGESLDLNPDQTIDLNFFNSAFSEEALRLDYSWGFTIPASPKNKRLMGFPHQLDVLYEGQKDLQVEAAFGGKNYPAKLVLLESGPGGFEVSVTLNLGGFEVLDNLLWELGISTSPLIYTLPDDIEGVEDQYYPNMEFCLPQIINNDFYGHYDDDVADVDKANATFEGVINAYDVANNQFLRNGTNQGVVENKNAIVPMPFLMFILKRGFDKMGLKMTGRWMESEFAKRLFIYANFSVEYFQPVHEYKGTGEAVSNTEPYSNQAHVIAFDSTTGYFNGVNNTYTFLNSGSYAIEIDFELMVGNLSAFNVDLRPQSGGAYIWRKIITTSAGFASKGKYKIRETIVISGPFLNIPYVFEFNWAAGGGGLPDAEWRDINVVVRRRPFEVPNEFGTFTGWGEKGLPEVTFGELLAELKKPPFGLTYRLIPETREVQIEQRLNQLSNPEHQPLEVERGIKIPNDEIKPYVIAYQEPGNDRYVEENKPIWLKKKILVESGNISLIEYNKEVPDALEIELKMSPFHEVVDGVGQLRLEEPGTSDKFEISGANPSLRIGVYRGLLNEVPSGSVNDFLGDGWSFLFDDENNLFKTYTYPWLTYKVDARRLKAVTFLTPGAFAQLNIENKVSFNRHFFLVDNIQTSLESDQFVRVEMELHQI